MATANEATRLTGSTGPRRKSPAQPNRPVWSRFVVGHHILPALLLVALAGTAGLVVLLVVRAPTPSTGAEYAAWVQAAGSVAAIIATAGVAWWVPWSAARERRIGMRRTAAFQLTACSEAVATLLELLREEVGSNGRMFGNPLPQPIKYSFGHYIGMLSSYPMHETADGDIPSAFLRMHNCLIRASRVVDDYNAHLGRTMVLEGRQYADALDRVAQKAATISDEFWKHPVLPG